MRNRLFAGLAASCVAVLLTAAAALGHADLVESDPPAGGNLETTPHTLTAIFDHELDAAASSVVVRNADGDEVASGGVSEGDQTTMVVQLPTLEPGEYTVRWTAVTPDDQAVERGSYTFTVGTSAPPAPGDGQPAGGSNDLIVALALIGVAIAGVAAYIVMRRRR